MNNFTVKSTYIHRLLLPMISQSFKKINLFFVFVLRYVLCTVCTVRVLHGFTFSHSIALYQIRIFSALSSKIIWIFPQIQCPLQLLRIQTWVQKNQTFIVQYCIQFNFISSSLDELDFYMDKSDYFWDSVVQYIYTNQRDLTSEARPF